MKIIVTDAGVTIDLDGDDCPEINTNCNCEECDPMQLARDYREAVEWMRSERDKLSDQLDNIQAAQCETCEDRQDMRATIQRERAAKERLRAERDDLQAQLEDCREEYANLAARQGRRDPRIPRRIDNADTADKG